MLYLSDQRRNRIVELTSAMPPADGEPALPWRTLAPDAALGRLNRQSGLAAVPGRSTLLVADTGNNRIVVLDANGGPSAVLDPALTPVGPLRQPRGVAVDSQQPGVGPLFVIADTGNHRVLFGGSLETPEWSSVGTAGTGQGQFLAPSALCPGPNGSVLVSDPAARRLIVLDSTDPLMWEEILLPAGELPCTPFGLTPGGGGTVLVTDLTGGRVLLFDAGAVTVLVDGAADRSLLAPVAAVRVGQDMVVADAASGELGTWTLNVDTGAWERTHRLPGVPGPLGGPEFSSLAHLIQGVPA